MACSKDGTGIAELRAKIAALIDWNELSRSTRPRLWQRIRDVIDQLRSQGRIVVLYAALEKELRALLGDEYDGDAVRTVVGQLACQGEISDTRLATGERALLLQLGYVEIYAGSLIRLARESAHAGGVPAVELAEAIFRKSFPGISDRDRLSDPLTERSVLECVIELMIEHGICLKHERLLVFPELFPARAAADSDGAQQAVSLFYDFSGAIGSIYSSLVAQLAVSQTFGRVRLWKDRAEFERTGQGVCALRRLDRAGGWSHLDLLFSESVAPATRDLFTAIIEEHLQKEGVTIREVLEMECPQCRYRLDEPLLRQRIDRGHADVICPVCETRFVINTGAKKNDPQVLNALIGLRKTIADHKHRDIKDSKRQLGATAASMTQVIEPPPIRILHLSDLHFGKDDDPLVLLQPLLRDLRDRQGGLGFGTVDYLVISGDLTQRAAPAEFERAYVFISTLIRELSLSAARVVITPGNHDLSWEPAVYQWQPRRNVDVSKLKPDSYVQQGNGYLVRDDASYHKRWENFRRFYHQLTQHPYTPKPEGQFRAQLFHDLRVQFLELNSAWEIDEYYRERSSIHPSALASGLMTASAQLGDARLDGRIAQDSSVFRIAVWHHPVTGNEKINSDAFLDQLRQEGFRLCLHGHVHEDRTDVVGYLHPRQLHVAGAGSFGAPMSERPESTPRLYNVLELARDHSRLRVHTRCLRKDGGAWEGWAVWSDEDQNKRRTFYELPF